MNDYQSTITLNTSAKLAYSAITQHIVEWWSNDLSGAAAQPGDIFDIAFGTTRKTFEIVAATSNSQVIWKCTKAFINIPGLDNKTEWEGTKMIWTLTEANGVTTIHLLHEGLNESLGCYEKCEQGWESSLNSLQQYLATGTGHPNIKTKTV